MPNPPRSLALLALLAGSPACFGPTCTSTTGPERGEPASSCPGSAPTCHCFDHVTPADCDVPDWVCPPGWGIDHFDPSCGGGTTTSTTTSTTPASACWIGPDGVCEPGLGEGCDCPDCDGTALCNPFQCVDDGACTILDACTCTECADDTFCSSPGNCDRDGTCDGFYEGCACGDCAAVPGCAGAGGAGGAGGAAGAGGAGGADGVGAAGGAGGAGFGDSGGT